MYSAAKSTFWSKAFVQIERLTCLPRACVCAPSYPYTFPSLRTGKGIRRRRDTETCVFCVWILRQGDPRTGPRIDADFRLRRRPFEQGGRFALAVALWGASARSPPYRLGWGGVIR